MSVNDVIEADRKKQRTFVGTVLSAIAGSARFFPKNILLQVFGWVASKTWLRGVTELGDIVGPLIQAEELIKLDPTLPSRLRVSYSALRDQIKKRYRRDLVGEIAGTPAIGKLTVEAHARAVVASYNEHLGLGDRAWFERLTQEAVAASERAYALYFK
jgi:hypothetical protein